MGLLKFIADHYSNVHYERTEAQIEKEEWLIKDWIPFHRYWLMPSALLTQICCGSLYAWSGLNLPLEAYILGRNGGIDRATASITFYVSVGNF